MENLGSGNRTSHGKNAKLLDKLDDLLIQRYREFPSDVEGWSESDNRVQRQPTGLSEHLKMLQIGMRSWPNDYRLIVRILATPLNDARLTSKARALLFRHVESNLLRIPTSKQRDDLFASLPKDAWLERTLADVELVELAKRSGKLSGRRAIYGGRRAVRSGLYMAALVAARYNPILRVFYQRLRAAGKTTQTRSHRRDA